MTRIEGIAQIDSQEILRNCICGLSYEIIFPHAASSTTRFFKI